jgi:flagellar biosynthetic protein FliS
VVVLLLEGAQRFLAKADDAMKKDDAAARDYYLKRVGTILKELHGRLNHDQGGELVVNLIRLYAWWRAEILQAVAKGEAERLRRVHAQMGEIRRAWEVVLFRGEGMSESPAV